MNSDWNIVTPSTAHMSIEERQTGIPKMVAELTRLAEQDGCIAAAWALELVDKVWAQRTQLALQCKEIECWRSVKGGQLASYQLDHFEWGSGPTLINVDSVIDNMLNEDGISEVSRDDYKQLRDRLKALVPGQKCRYGNWIVTMTLVPIEKIATMHKWDGW